MILRNQLIMTIGKTKNDWELTEDMLKNSWDTFYNAPIVYNSREQDICYNTEDFSQYFEKTKLIGFVIKPVNILDNNVYADINIIDDFANLWNGHYDNWCIDISEKNQFKLIAIEVF